MKAIVCGLAAALLAVLSCVARPAASPSLPPLAIERVTVIDVERARAVSEQTVLVEHGRIARIGSDVAAPPGAERIDGRGKYLVPGLVDMHVHLFNNATHRAPNTWTFPLFVANGVTGVREMMTLPGQVQQVARWRQSVDRGTLVAPYVLAAGVAVRGDTVEDARRQVRVAVRSGADFIKVFSDVPSAQWHAIIAAARRARVPVDGHVPAQVPLLEAADAGQRTAEHLLQAYEACSSVERRVLASRRGLDGDAAEAMGEAQERDVLGHFSPNRCAAVARAVAAAHQTQVPTLVLSHFEAHRRADFAADPRWPLLREDEQARWRRILASEATADAALAARREQVSCAIVRALHAAGVDVLAGTDTPMPMVYPGYALHDELELLVQCGLGPAQALRAVTIGPAELLHLSQTNGSIAVGKRADLVLLDGDPLQDVRNLRRIRAVVLAGRLLRREDLDALLAAGAGR
ncbi:MAG: amidohydrolase family protein [Mizugakiibacter sp.]|uniref:amidohydrolase family protein n=1 Tax=Mizugakiibacter sp. TaxID=1972610 RepID=UPI0031CB3B1E|nr:amidohydrolase family protein [Xanthomonadaceae bacterium]